MEDKTSVANTEDSKEVQATEARPVAYFYKDKQLGQEFPIFDAREGTWWMDRTKVEILMERFKYNNTTKQAAYLAGITYEQFKHFALVHKWVYPLIRVYRAIPAITLKDIVLKEALGDPKNGIPPSAKMALGALKFFNVKEDDPEASDDAILASIPSGGASVRTISEAILNEEGKVVVSRQTAEILRKMKEHGPTVD